MQFSTKVRYALRIALDIALHADDSTPRDVGRIAASQNISAKYMSRLMIPLRRAGLVASEPGPRGGYRLTRPPEAITWLDVVEAMEGPVSLVRCVTKPSSCRRAASCTAVRCWQKLNDGFRGLLAAQTLADLLPAAAAASGEQAAESARDGKRVRRS